jgi:hypothetical protein
MQEVKMKQFQINFAILFLPSNPDLLLFIF